MIYLRPSKFTYIAFFGLLWIISPIQVNADVGSLYTNASTTYDTSGTTNETAGTNHTNASGDGFGIYLGTGYANKIYSYTIDIEQYGADNRSRVMIFECDDINNINAGTCRVAFQEYHVGSSTVAFETFYFGVNSTNQETYGSPTTNDSFTFNVNKWYWVLFTDNTGSASTRRIKSSTVDSINGVNCYRNCSNSVDIAFSLNTTNPNQTGYIQEGATVPINKNIEILSPTYGTTTASTSVFISIKYKTPFSIDFRPTTTRHYQITDALTGELEYSYSYDLAPNIAENLTINATNTLSTGSKYIRAMYLDEQGNVYSEVDEVFFSVINNTYASSTGLLTPRDNPSGLTQIDCGTFEIGCQFQKAITFLFVPSPTVLDKFKNLWQTIAEKKPFGYVTVTIRQLQSLNESGSQAFTLGTIPFMESFFIPFRTAISTILWALFAIYFYQRRLKHLDI